MLSRPAGSLGAASPKPASRRYFWLAALALLCLLMMGAVALKNSLYATPADPKSAAQEAEAERPVASQKSAAAPVSNEALSAAGVVKARQISTVSTELTGTIARIYVRRGDRVKRGQPVAELDTTIPKNAMQEAAMQLASAQNDRQRASQLLPLIKASYQRQLRLATAHLTSEQEVENAKSEVIRQEAEVRALSLQVEINQNLLQRGEINLSKAIIRAPYDGIIVSLDAALGEIVSPVSSGDSFARTGVATIVSTDPFHADIWVPDSFLDRLALQQKVQVAPDGLPAIRVPGWVSFISPVVDENRAAVLVQVELTKQPAVLKHGMSVHVDFQARPGSEEK